jgi:RHS repeat-associated protein
MAVVNADGPTPTVKEATWYHPYGTMETLHEQTIPVRTKFTGKEFDKSDPQYAEVNFDITVTDFDGGSLPYGMLYVNYRDASDPSSMRFQKGYLFSYDETNQVYTLKTSDKFPKSVNIEFLQINLRQPDGTYKRNRVVPSPFYSLTLNSSSTLSFNVTKTAYDTSSTTNLYAPVNPITIVYGNKGSELFYFGARYYDAELGVWTSTDPIEQFWSGYSYTGNGYNPVNAVDPDGLAVYDADFVGPCQNGDIRGGQLQGNPFDFTIAEHLNAAYSQLIVQYTTPKNYVVAGFILLGAFTTYVDAVWAAMSSRSLTVAEWGEIQIIATKYNTTIDVVGSRAAGVGRNIETNLPKCKGSNTRSDIDFRIDASNTQVNNLIKELKNVGGGVGSASTKYSTTTRATTPPFIRFEP